MKRVFVLSLALSSVLWSGAAFAQAKPVMNDQSITVLSGIAYGALNSAATPVDAAHPLPTIQAPIPAAGSIALQGSLTPSVVTPTSGAATIAAGVATLGPLAPELGRGIRVILRGTWTGSVAIGTSVDGCVTINPLTIGGSAWGVFTAAANEIVDIPTLAGVSYCATAKVTSGTLTYGVRQ